MKRWIARIFHRQPVGEIYADQLFDAERHYAEHMAAAEHHAALAAMYLGRMKRINQQQTGAAELRAVK